MTIEVGQYHVGAFRSKRFVTAVEDGIVRYREPRSVGLPDKETPVAEFEAWKALAP